MSKQIAFVATVVWSACSQIGEASVQALGRRHHRDSRRSLDGNREKPDDLGAAGSRLFEPFVSLLLIAVYWDIVLYARGRILSGGIARPGFGSLVQWDLFGFYHYY